MSDRFLLPFSEYQIVRQVISLNFQNLQLSDRFMGSTSRISKRLTGYLSFFKTIICPTGSYLRFSEYQNVRQVIPYIFKILICPTDSYLQLSENRNVRQVISFNFETSICPTDSYLQLVEYRNVRQVIFLYFKVFI